MAHAVVAPTTTRSRNKRSGCAYHGWYTSLAVRSAAVAPIIMPAVATAPAAVQTPVKIQRRTPASRVAAVIVRTDATAPSRNDAIERIHSTIVEYLTAATPPISKKV